MPWTIADVDKHKKGLTVAQKKKWVSVANSVLGSCLKDGTSNDVCEGRAIRIANKQAVEAAAEFHECRLCSSSKFDKFEYVDGVNPNMLVGLRRDDSEVQAFYYPANTWTREQAKKHCEGKGGVLLSEQKGQGGEPAGAGGTDKCACPNPKCTQYKKPVAHERGTPCNTMKCSVCKTPLTGVGTVGSKLKKGK